MNPVCLRDTEDDVARGYRAAPGSFVPLHAMVVDACGSASELRAKLGERGLLRHGHRMTLVFDAIGEDAPRRFRRFELPAA